MGFFGNGLEAVHTGEWPGDLVDFALGSRVDAFGDLLLDLQPLGSRLGQGDGRINAECCSGPLFTNW